MIETLCHSYLFYTNKWVDIDCVFLLMFCEEWAHSAYDLWCIIFLCQNKQINVGF